MADTEVAYKVANTIDVKVSLTIISVKRRYEKKRQRHFSNKFYTHISDIVVIVHIKIRLKLQLSITINFIYMPVMYI
jgi:hypothetical protein